MAAALFDRRFGGLKRRVSSFQCEYSFTIEILRTPPTFDEEEEEEGDLDLTRLLLLLGFFVPEGAVEGPFLGALPTDARFLGVLGFLSVLAAEDVVVEAIAVAVAVADGFFTAEGLRLLPIDIMPPIIMPPPDFFAFGASDPNELSPNARETAGPSCKCL